MKYKLPHYCMKHGLSWHFWNNVVVPLVRKRCGYMCVSCGGEKQLITHHIVPNVQVLQNLVTLCRKCHREIHKER